MEHIALPHPPAVNPLPETQTMARLIALLAVLSALMLAPSAPVAYAATAEYNLTHGVALSGYDPVAYFTEGRPVKGNAAHVFSYGPATYHFASEKNRATFAANPARYAPKYGGYCAYGMARGYKAPIDPAAFTIVRGSLYMNYSQSVQRTWRKDIHGYVERADHNWPSVKSE